MNDVDEFPKISFIDKDFYTNSIHEANPSFVEKGNILINNLPKTFVKQFEKASENRNEVKKKSNDLDEYKIQKQMKSYREANCRKLLLLAQKGEKDNFIKTLEMLY